MKQHVLVIDDEPGILNVVRIKLGLLGYRVSTTSSGIEALESIRINEPDIVLLDLLMPEISGEDFLSKLRESSRVPVVVFTAKLDVGNSLAPYGISEIVLKPFDPDRLACTIASVLERCG